MKAIKCTVDGRFIVIDLTRPVYQSIQEHIGGWMEVFCTYTQSLVPWINAKSKIVMIADDEGLIRKKDENVFGSLLYGTNMHGIQFLSTSS